jgi:leucyl-tRNA---protein transferase
MRIYSPPEFSEFSTCPYLEDQKYRYRYFFADQLNEDELDYFLATGHRKFGQFFFIPACGVCQRCIPLRVKANDFSPSKSQRRVINKNRNTNVSIHTLNYDEEIYELYVLHSQAKFDTVKHPVASSEEFKLSHFTKSSPSFLTKYYVENKLVAVGFVDVSTHGLSSVYFIYHPDWEFLSLGTFGALKEIDLCREMQKDYYYLGYFIKENLSMSYKAKFKPYQLYQNQKWHDVK